MSTPAASAMGDAGRAAGGPAGGGQTQQQPGGGGPAGGGQTQQPPAGGGKPFWDALVPANDAELRPWLAAKNFGTPIDLFKAHRTLETEAQTLRSVKAYPATIEQDGSIKAGDENAIRAWRQFAGVPEKPEAYNIPMPEGSPFPQLKEGMAKIFHDAGVPPAMATRLAIGYNETLGKLQQAYEAHENAESERGLQALRDEWGANFGERAAIADRGWRFLQAQYARLNPGADGKPGQLSDTQKRVLESSLGTPTFMKLMNAIGAGNKEGSFAGDPNLNQGGFQGGESELDQQIDRIYKDRSEGKITDHEWRTTKEAEYMKLLEAKAQRQQAALMAAGGGR